VEVEEYESDSAASDEAFHPSEDEAGATEHSSTAILSLPLLFLAPDAPRMRIPASHYYPIRLLPVVTSYPELHAQLWATGLALIDVAATFLGHWTAKVGASAAQALPAIREETTWETIANAGSRIRPGLRKVGYKSHSGWQAEAAAWLHNMLHPRNVLTFRSVKNAAGLLRLPGVPRQPWHGDAAHPNTLRHLPPDMVPLSCIHPLSSEGTAILAVPTDSGTPVQIQVPPRHILLFRGDLEHCGDEWHAENIALFANLDPATAIFVQDVGPQMETLTFFSHRKHTHKKLTVFPSAVTVACAPASPFFRAHPSASAGGTL